MFDADISVLKMNENRQNLLRLLDINTIDDLIHYYPNRYEIIEFKPIVEHDSFIVEGIVIDPPKFYRPRFNLTILSFHIKYNNEEVLVKIFNRHYLRTKLTPGTIVTVIGKCENDIHSVMATDLKIKPLNECKGIFPVYGLKTGLKNKDLQGYVAKALKYVDSDLYDFIPEEYIHKYNLIYIKEALHYIHFPDTMEHLKEAVKYLKYEEFFLFQATLLYLKKTTNQIDAGVKKKFDFSKLQDYILHLPFRLTADQEIVCKEILQDLTSTHLMDRLVQGDVGSGKTVVASIAIYANYLSGYQSALMAPTEILARQHFATFEKLFQNSDIKMALLVGSLSVKEKNDIYQRLINHDIDLLIGTHALIQEKVNFKNLGLVIADEQHRFGVNQRKKLSEKGDKVDFLTMSATPIPRTLAMILYGDKDVSIIRHKPGERKERITKVIQTRSMKPILPQMEKYIASGGQVYVVCPLIEENENYDLQSATKIYNNMMKYYKNKIRIGLLHGRMDEDKKDEVMKQFVDHEIDLLVSTTVIEVGVDVRNANMMIIYDAHRFGLSQLHQLRGRIGRGDEVSYCYLFTSSSDQEALERLKLLENNEDGFDIANEDLKLRGPGDFIGSRQSGLPSFLIANIMKDFNILEKARNDALETMDHIDEEKYYYLKKIIQNKVKNNDTYVD